MAKIKITKEQSQEIAKATFIRIIDPFYVGGAAELSFWLLLSMVPATILLAQIMQFFTISAEAALKVLELYLSEEVLGLISPLLVYRAQGGVTLLLIILALWSGSSVVFTLMRVANRAYGSVPENVNPIMWVVIEKLRSILLTLIMLIAMIFALYILVYGEIMVQMSLSYNNVFLGMELTFSEVWFGMRWLIALLLFFIMAFTIYSTMPRLGRQYKKPSAPGNWAVMKKYIKFWWSNARLASRRALPGSIFTAVLMLLVTWIFTIVISFVSLEHFSVLYGGLQWVVLLLVWFYIISFIVITGVQLNAAFAEYIETGSKAGAKTDDEAGE
jgi:membrane protein